MEKKKKIVFYIGEVKHKNLMMIEIITNLGIDLTIFYSKIQEDLKDKIPEGVELIKLKKKFLERTLQLNTFLRKTSVDLFQMYSGSGRFSPIYSLLVWMHRFRFILIERGGGTADRFYGEKMHWATRLGIRLQYKLSQNLLYKEPYMKQYIKGYNFENIFFLPNAVRIPEHDNPLSFEDRAIDYLWVNRIIPLRWVDWIIKIAESEKFQNKNFVIAGFLNDPYSIRKKKEIEEKNLSNVTILDYGADIWKLYEQARYFLLPAALTFGNNAILESMSYGVVPIVSQGAEGMEVLIDDPRNGLVSSNEFNDFRKKMEQSLDIAQSQWSEMSHNASEKIKKEFSEEIYEKNLIKMYQSLLDSGQ